MSKKKKEKLLKFLLLFARCTMYKIFFYKFQAAGLGSRIWSDPGVFGSLEPEPLEKKPGVGAGATWKKSQEPEPEPLKN